MKLLFRGGALHKVNQVFPLTNTHFHLFTRLGLPLASPPPCFIFEREGRFDAWAEDAACLPSPSPLFKVEGRSRVTCFIETPTFGPCTSSSHLSPGVLRIDVEWVVERVPKGAQKDLRQVAGNRGSLLSPLLLSSEGDFRKRIGL
jgi:hypothetical protein